MKCYIAIIISCLSFTIQAAKSENFEPVELFSNSIVPSMSAFETTKIETTLRGFWIHGDSWPGMRANDELPSAYGMFLRVTIHDEGINAKFRDQIEKKTHSDKLIGDNIYTIRNVTLPQHSTNDDSLEIEFSYGSEASKDIVNAINLRIDQLIKPYK